MIGPFRQRVRKECRPCRGSGRIVSDPCRKCKGEGRAYQPFKVKFSIKPGVSSGTRLRMRGQGESSSAISGEPGDLHIEIDVDPHEWFERDGKDLLMALPLSFADLSLGTTVEIPHIDKSPLKIKIPPGSSPGETISIRGRGLPSYRAPTRRGSVTVVLKLELPSKQSRSMKKKISEIRDEMEGELPSLEDRIRNDAKLRRRNG